MRRERGAGSPDDFGARPGQEMGLWLHGDIGQDQLQRQGVVPGAAEHGEEEEREPQHGHQQEEVAAEEGEAKREVLAHVD